MGVSEPLNETAFGEGLVSRGQHYVVASSLSDPDKAMLQEKELTTSLALRPWIFVTPAEKLSFEEWNEYFQMMVWSLLTGSF